VDVIVIHSDVFIFVVICENLCGPPQDGVNASGEFCFVQTEPTNDPNRPL